jgi:hypothetical protein
MKQEQMFKKIARLATFSLALILLAGQVVQGQRAKPSSNNSSLLSNECRQKGNGHSIKLGDKIVSIGREVFDSIYVFGHEFFSEGEKTVLSCRFKQTNNTPTTLQLSFGIEDNEPAITRISVTVYLDGEQRASHTISSGDLRTVLLDVTKIRSVGIEIVCERGESFYHRCPNTHIVKASIIPATR